MFGLRNRGQLQTAVLNEFENLVAGLAGFLLTEHNEDGTHIIALPSAQLTPIGGMIEWPATTAPDKWLMCDGAQVNRVTYKSLFDVIGTTWGVGDGSTTFNVPDRRGRVGLGKTAAGTGSTLAGTGGALDHTHTGPSHTHTGPSHTHTGPDHTHTGPAHTHSSGTYDVSGNTNDAALDTSEVQAGTGISVTNDGVHNHSGAGLGITGSSGSEGTGATGLAGTGATGASGTGATSADGTGATSGNNMAFVAVNYIILAGV